MPGLLRIAVCDDDAAELARSQTLLTEFCARRPDLAAQVAAFGSAPDLLDALRRGADFDLYLLDVIMPEKNGIEVGKELRSLGRSGAIIYLTTSPDYAVDSYQTQAFYYLLKPVARDRLFAVLDRAVDALDKRKDQATIVSTAAGLRSIPLHDILYVERVERSMRYYLVGGETVDSRTLRGSLRSGAAPLLEDRRFFLCGASFVLGLHHVTSVERGRAALDSGGFVPVSQNACGELKQAWMNYWLGGEAL